MGKITTNLNFSFSKIRINGFDINPKNVSSISIFEGLTSPTVTGRIYIGDRQALLEIHEIMPGDLIEIDFTSKMDETVPLRFKGIITSNDGASTHGDQTFPTTVFQFCSEWWFKASTKQISKAYKNQSIDEIFDDLIFNECGGNFDSFNPGGLEKIERFVSPYWSPAHILKYLLNLASNKQGYTGYVLYENFIDDVVLARSLRALLAQGTNLSNVSPNEITVNAENPFYVGNTNSLFVESLSHPVRYLNQGMYQTDYLSFNYDNSQIHKSSTTADKIDFDHIRPVIPLKKDFATEEYKSTKFIWGPFQTQKTFNTDRQFGDYVDSIMENNYINIFSDMVKVNGLFPGDTGRRAGLPVKINFPSINTKKDIKARHKYLEGVYIIRNIQHIFTNDGFKQAITFVNDGIGSLERKDLKEW